MKRIIEIEASVSGKNLDSDEKDRIDETVSCLNRLKSAIQAFNEIQYISFLGVKASVAFINSIGALFLSGISTLLNMLTKSSNIQGR